MRKNIFFLVLTVAFALPQYVNAYTYPGDAKGFVSDFANLLSVAEVKQLESQIRAFEASTTNEIAVVTISSLEGDTVENYAVKLFEDWKIGKADRDNGILLIVARDDREVRIEVGYGLEGAVPDAISNQIIQKEILPHFRDGNYSAGIAAGVDGLISASQNEYEASPENIFRTPTLNEVGQNLTPILMAVLAVVTWLASILGRSKSWWLGGVFGGVGGVGLWVFLGLSTFVGGVILIILVALGLVFDYWVSNSYRSHMASGTHVPWWAGGGGMGGGRSGGGFGGFGGGSSGGAGASGRW